MQIFRLRTYFGDQTTEQDKVQAKALFERYDPVKIFLGSIELTWESMKMRIRKEFEHVFKLASSSPTGYSPFISLIYLIRELNVNVLELKNALKKSSVVKN